MRVDFIRWLCVYHQDDFGAVVELTSSLASRSPMIKDLLPGRLFVGTEWGTIHKVPEKCLAPGRDTE